MAGVVVLYASGTVAAGHELRTDAQGQTRVAMLEETFWACDYAATTRGVTATPMDLCGTAYQELRDLKFGGNFEELLGWWKANKAAEHRRVEDAGR